MLGMYSLSCPITEMKRVRAHATIVRPHLVVLVWRAVFSICARKTNSSALGLSVTVGLPSLRYEKHEGIRPNVGGL